MFISYESPCELQGHLKLKKCPAYYGIGIYEDVDGNRWDIRGIYGNDFVQARPLDGHCFYKTTGEICSYSISWKPYSYEPTLKIRNHD